MPNVAIVIFLMFGCLWGGNQAVARSASGDRLAQDDGQDQEQTNRAKKKKKKANASKVEHQSAAAMGGSEANRQHKTFFVEPEIGLINALDFGYGARAGFFLSRNALLEADYFTGSFSFLGLQNTVTLATARVQYFLGNSFYIAGGGGIRQLTAVDDFGDTLISDSGAFYSKQTATQGIVEATLGNQWQFGTFTLGCDWVGYAQPVGTLSTSETLGGASDAEQQASDEQDFKTSMTTGSLELVRFHLGMSF